MQERELKLTSGWFALTAVLIGLALIVLLYVVAAQNALPWLIFTTIGLNLLWLISLFGFIVNGPNQSRVVQLFGTYVGTVKDVGFFYGNPFYWRTYVSLRVHTFETGVSKTEEKKDAAGNVIVQASQHRQPSKVNDRDGTPIEVAAVVVWRVVNAAEAIFQVDKYEDFVHTQSEAALRNLVSRYPYDSHEDDIRSLRGHTAEVADELKLELQERLQQAGVEVLESRISYLAYAPEIAAAMLQRQQAGAVIAARQKIVEGAVGMVEMALEMLSSKNLLTLDDERKAAMVSNLLVVLCGDRNPQPVVNTGTLYN